MSRTNEFVQFGVKLNKKTSTRQIEKIDAYLHTDDRINEEQHRYQKTNVRQSLRKEKKKKRKGYLSGLSDLIKTTYTIVHHMLLMLFIIINYK